MPSPGLGAPANAALAPTRVGLSARTRGRILSRVAAPDAVLQGREPGRRPDQEHRLRTRARHSGWPHGPRPDRGVYRHRRSRARGTSYRRTRTVQPHPGRGLRSGPGRRPRVQPAHRLLDVADKSWETSASAPARRDSLEAERVRAHGRSPEGSIHRGTDWCCPRSRGNGDSTLLARRGRAWRASSSGYVGRSAEACIRRPEPRPVAPSGRFIAPGRERLTREDRALGFFLDEFVRSPRTVAPDGRRRTRPSRGSGGLSPPRASPHSPPPGTSVARRMPQRRKVAHPRAIGRARRRGRAAPQTRKRCRARPCAPRLLTNEIAA